MDTKQITSKKTESRNFVRRLVVRKGNTYHILKTKTISLIKADGNYVCIYCNGQKYLMRTTLKGLLDKLDKTIFEQIHRSTVVNIDYIQKIKRTVYGEFYVVMKNGDKLKMSRGYKDLLESN